MVLAQRQNYRSMEQNRKSRDKSMHLETHYLWQRRQKYTMDKSQSLQQVVLRNWPTICKRMKLEKFLTPNTKINSKWILRPKCKVRNYKTLRGKAAFLFLSLTRNFVILLWMWVRAYKMGFSQSACSLMTPVLFSFWSANCWGTFKCGSSKVCCHTEFVPFLWEVSLSINIWLTNAFKQPVISSFSFSTHITFQTLDFKIAGILSAEL